MREREITSAPDYTSAALTMLAVNLTWIFFVLWILAGFVPVLLLAAFLNHLVNRFAIRRQAQSARG